jgi:hypothetical protein
MFEVFGTTFMSKDQRENLKILDKYICHIHQVLSLINICHIHRVLSLNSSNVYDLLFKENYITFTK